MFFLNLFTKVENKMEDILPSQLKLSYFYSIIKSFSHLISFVFTCKYEKNIMQIRKDIHVNTIIFYGNY